MQVFNHRALLTRILGLRFIYSSLNTAHPTANNMPWARGVYNRLPFKGIRRRGRGAPARAGALFSPVNGS